MCVEILRLRRGGGREWNNIELAGITKTNPNKNIMGVGIIKSNWLKVGWKMEINTIKMLPVFLIQQIPTGREGDGSIRHKKL
jgi:hypothetical protein